MRHVNKEFEEYLLGEMDSYQAGQFEKHVENCRRCSTALQDARNAHRYMKWLKPPAPPPKPGPGFYWKVRSSIERKKAQGGWIGSLAAVLHGPRLVYPLLFLFFSLLLTAWNMNSQAEWSDAGVLGIPPARFSQKISSPADRRASRDLVMVSLVGGQR